MGCCFGDHDAPPAARYQTKPREVDAWRYMGRSIASEQPQFIRSLARTESGHTWILHTIDGDVPCPTGCWIVHEKGAWANDVRVLTPEQFDKEIEPIL